MRRVVTAVSTAWAMASKPAAAVTARGCDTVSSGSRSAAAKASFGSPHAIFMWVAVSAMTA